MIITDDMLKSNIMLPNPGERVCTISSRETGCYQEQVFTSEDLPKKIPWKLIGLVKFPDGRLRPKYKAEVVTETKLYLKGRRGRKNGVDIINRICHELCFQDGFFDAKGIKRSDLIDEGDEKLSYWLDSSTDDEIISVVDFSGDIIVCGSSPCSSNSMIFSQTLSDETGFAVRPTIILDVEIKITHNHHVPFVEL